MSRGVEERTPGTGDSSGKPVVRELHDREEILQYLELDRPYTAGAFSYLEAASFPDSRWFAVEGEQGGLSLLGTGPNGGLVLTMGTPVAVAATLDAAVGPLQLQEEAGYLQLARHLPLNLPVGVWHQLPRQVGDEVL